MSDWKPIETAPKDGSRFLAGNENFVAEVSWRTPDSASFCTTFEEDAYWYRVDYQKAFMEKTIWTDWMPLPEPPKHSQRQSSKEED